MTLLQVFVLSVVQGITEFLPISSSAHLILVPELTGWQDQGLLVDLAVHVGTLLAVLVYFRKDVRLLFAGLAGLLLNPRNINPAEGSSAPNQMLNGRQLTLALIIGVFPIVVIGGTFVAFDLVDGLRDIEVIGWTSIIFGILLYGADRYCGTDKKLEAITLKNAFFIGMSQVLAIIPGTSRSGITMTAARYLGFNRVDSARFSMLLAMPTIAISGLAGLIKLLESGDQALIEYGLLAGVLSFAVAIAAIHLFIKWLSHASMTPFVIYRVLLGAGLLAWVYI